MNNEIYERVKQVLNKQLSEILEGKDISVGDQLINLGINSITFIKIAVALEAEFDVEFEDEDLDASKFKTVEDIVAYLEKKTDG